MTIHRVIELAAVLITAFFLGFFTEETHDDGQTHIDADDG